LSGPIERSLDSPEAPAFAFGDFFQGQAVKVAQNKKPFLQSGQRLHTSAEFIGSFFPLEHPVRPGAKVRDEIELRNPGRALPASFLPDAAPARAPAIDRVISGQAIEPG
jgi:hypothetical protein